MGALVTLLNTDNSVQVKDTVAWTIGRICEHTPGAVLQPLSQQEELPEASTLIQLLEALCIGLGREPRVAANICWVNYFSDLIDE